MPDTSPVLELPYLQPSQAQKHVTHNEALRRLDLVVQLRVQAVGAETPPDTPLDGEVHALGASPSGVWAGQAWKLAAWLDGAWQFIEPVPGWRAWDLGAARLRVWDGAGWGLPPAETQNLEGVGIATTFDATNRLSVQAPATLLTHAGAGHQLKVNKAAPGDTASLLFQSGWTGHAEMGLAGDTAFSVKVSPDGSTWTTALSLDPATGLAQGAAVQASATDTTAGRLMRADYGYGPGNLLGAVTQSGGVPTGAVIEQGSNANGDYVRYADGTQMCWEELFHNNTLAGGATASGTWNVPAAFAGPPAVLASSYSAINITAAEQAAQRLRGAAAGTADGLSVYWALHNSSGSSQSNARLYLLAIGRWFETSEATDMIITFTPMRRNDRLELHRQADCLTVNGEIFDFSALPEGATLPKSAVACPWLASDVERIDGRLHLSLILPHGPAAGAAARFPDRIELDGDGPVALPQGDETA